MTLKETAQATPDTMRYHFYEANYRLVDWIEVNKDRSDYIRGCYHQLLRSGTLSNVQLR